MRAKALPYWLRAALVNEFGSVNAARELAGLDAIRGDGVAPTQVLPQIKELHAKGVSLAYTHAPRALVTAAVATFGSWQSAIDAAGIDYAHVGLKVKRFSDDDLLDWLRSLAKERPVTMLGELSKEEGAAIRRGRGEIRQLATCDETRGIERLAPASETAVDQARDHRCDAQARRRGQVDVDEPEPVQRGHPTFRLSASGGRSSRHPHARASYGSVLEDTHRRNLDNLRRFVKKHG